VGEIDGGRNDPSVALASALMSRQVDARLSTASSASRVPKTMPVLRERTHPHTRWSGPLAVGFAPVHMAMARSSELVRDQWRRCRGRGVTKDRGHDRVSDTPGSILDARASTSPRNCTRGQRSRTRGHGDESAPVAHHCLPHSLTSRRTAPRDQNAVSIPLCAADRAVHQSRWSRLASASRRRTESPTASIGQTAR
jgi:hypothetical protein